MSTTETTGGPTADAPAPGSAAVVALLVPVPVQPEPEELDGEVRHPELAVVASGTLVSDTAR